MTVPSQTPGSFDPVIEPRGGPDRRKIAGLVLGLVVFPLLLILPPPDGMSPVAWRVAAVGVLMAAWWVSEALPVPATALIPLAAFLFLGVAPIQTAAAPYANPLIFLFMGGFMIALAMERWNLHRRIALKVLKLAGNRQDGLIAGFMAATAGLSMWVSNTATTVMMLPIALSVVRLLLPASAQDANDGKAPVDPFPVALLLGIAYAASIGGLGTLIGTPPNALLAGFMAESYGIRVGFAQWMTAGLPLVAVMLVLAWAVLTKLAFPVGGRRIGGAAAVIDAELAGLGRPRGARNWPDAYSLRPAPRGFCAR